VTRRASRGAQPAPRRAAPAGATVQDRLRRLARVLGVVSTVALWAAGTGLVLMTAFIAWQVFGRYVLNASPTWTEPLSVMIMGWFIFLGAAVGIREGYHLSFDVLLYVVPERAKPVLHTVSDLVVVAFGGGMVWFGSQLVVGTWDARLPSIGLPGGFGYMALVAGGLLAVIFSLERIARRLAGLPTARFAEAAIEE
jgi:TRAP-type C4-dicarboxylate transport system permease small subunit